MTKTGWGRIGPKMKRSHFFTQREVSFPRGFCLHSSCTDWSCFRPESVALQQRDTPPCKSCKKCADLNPGAKLA